MAAGLLEKMLRSEGMAGFAVSSAGSVAASGEEAAEEAVAVAAERGVDLTGHRSRPIDRQMLQAADLILCMTRQHKESVVRLEPRAEEKVRLLASLAPGSTGEEEIADPAGGGVEAFDECLTEMEKPLVGLVKRIKEGTI
jgi:protein-tyrosine-phosphatase